MEYMVWTVSFLILLGISHLWAKGLDKNKYLNKDNCGWLDCDKYSNDDGIKRGTK